MSRKQHSTQEVGQVVTQPEPTPEVVAATATVKENAKYPWSPSYAKWYAGVVERAEARLATMKANLALINATVAGRTDTREERKATKAAERLAKQLEEAQAKLAALLAKQAQPAPEPPQES